MHHNVEGDLWERKISATVKWQFTLTCLNRSGSKMMQHEQREPKTNRDSKSRRHRARHSPAPEWGAEALPPAAPSTPESRASPATPSSGLLLRVACTSGWQHRLFALKSTAQKEVRTRWFRFRHHHLLLWREAGSPTVARLVSSRVCWATEGTSTTPASHLFLSPAEEGGCSGDTQEAEEKMVEKMLSNVFETGTRSQLDQAQLK